MQGEEGKLEELETKIRRGRNWKRHVERKDPRKKGAEAER